MKPDIPGGRIISQIGAASGSIIPLALPKR
jgi:hypothetical protein